MTPISMKVMISTYKRKDHQHVWLHLDPPVTPFQPDQKKYEEGIDQFVFTAEISLWERNPNAEQMNMWSADQNMFNDLYNNLGNHNAMNA